jgi:hypothetical protein
MTPAALAFVEQLRSDRIRAEFVEHLRASASLLDGSSPLPEHVRTEVGATLARELRGLAAQLCDHGRLCSDGTCRYCGAAIGDEEPST